jgi:Raf kinase inhibitor-like YbhB/YbcL family protein
MVVTALIVGACAGGSVGRPAHDESVTTTEAGMQLTSTAFAAEGSIPPRHTCDGDDVSPPLTVRQVPDAAVTLVLVMDDPDAPSGVWDHWIAYDIPVSENIPESVEPLGTPGKNSWGRTGYGGPCPPGGTHRYFFTMYALDTTLGLAPGVDKQGVLEAMEGHVLAEASLMGRYGR